MFNIYLKIDQDFINHLNIENRKLVVDFLESTGVNTKISKKENNSNSETSNELMASGIFCPYCNQAGIYLKDDIFLKSFNFCPDCGEASPNMKINHSLSNAKEFIELLDYLLEFEGERRWGRTILEQSIVVIATGIEIFFRDVYSLVMDLRFVKSDKTLLQWFYDDCKNEFVNIGKIRKRFKDDLNIDIKNILGKNKYEKLNNLLLKRNAIVHNNGIVDNTFKSQSSIACELKNKIPLDKNEIVDYTKIVKEFVNDINIQFANETKSRFIEKFEEAIPDIFNSPDIFF